MPPAPAKASGPKRACRQCGHWSNSPEFGMDSGSGYCEVWEKITLADFSCERFLSREEHRARQDERLQQMIDEGEIEE